MIPFSETDLLELYPYESAEPLLIDVGAGVGDTALPFAVKGWSVVAFEPENVNYKVCRKALSPYKKVKLEKLAVSDMDNKKVNFYISMDHFGIHSLIPFHKSHTLEYQIKTCRLDTYISRNKIKNVTLLKIDIEGADFLALRSFDFNKFNPELIMTEFMDSRSKPNYGYGYKDMILFMEKFGYSAYVSEWEEILGYAKSGVETKPHTWKKCVRSDKLSGHPVWGNLIFVKQNKNIKFEFTLMRYLLILNFRHKFQNYKGLGFYLNRLILFVKRIYKG